LLFFCIYDGASIGFCSLYTPETKGLSLEEEEKNDEIMSDSKLKCCLWRGFI
jgi:hypothetical protein